MEVTVVLVPQAAAGLEAVRRRSGLSVTDIINRAITLYEFADGQLGDGSQILVRGADGTLRAVKLL